MARSSYNTRTRQLILDYLRANPSRAVSAADIVAHLERVAAAEGIAFEPEALNVIARKADGGMRDALSIFDQVASFTNGNITYKKVIEDLNVLDADNYFNIIDLCLENKAAGVMTLLNGIINKGFDGGHLISGLAVHVRNVLMAKDEQTLPLLQTSSRQAERYKEQAKRCPANFLYKALKIMNDCDINYRQSGNKRLLVELTLIEIAQITQPDDEGAASGRGPKRLKSLFKRLKSAQPSEARQVAEAEARTTASETAKPDTDRSANAATQAAADARPQQTQPLKGLKLGKIGKTFDNLRHRGEERQETETVVEVKDNGERSHFTEDQLMTQWLAMCNRMPREMTGIAARLKNMTPTMKDFPHVEAVVDNQILFDDIQKIKGRIRNTLVLALKNSDITLDFRLAKPEEIKRIPTNRERFDELKTNNKAFEKLSELLELELG